MNTTYIHTYIHTRYYVIVVPENLEGSELDPLVVLYLLEAGFESRIGLLDICFCDTVVNIVDDSDGVSAEEEKKKYMKS